MGSIGWSWEQHRFLMYQCLSLPFAFLFYFLAKRGHLSLTCRYVQYNYGLRVHSLIALYNDLYYIYKHCNISIVNTIKWISYLSKYIIWWGFFVTIWIWECVCIYIYKLIHTSVCMSDLLTNHTLKLFYLLCFWFKVRKCEKILQKDIKFLTSSAERHLAYSDTFYVMEKNCGSSN